MHFLLKLGIIFLVFRLVNFNETLFVKYIVVMTDSIYVVDVKKFVADNITPYEGDASFLQ